MNLNKIFFTEYQLGTIVHINETKKDERDVLGRTKLDFFLNDFVDRHGQIMSKYSCKDIIERIV
jgi:hypothetical protein